jgi:O-antigen/teichoic acid export membrane protein
MTPDQTYQTPGQPPLPELESGRTLQVFRSEVARQAAAFTGGNLAANALAIISTAIATRTLATSEFGNYAFASSVVLFVALFFEFGLFLPAARLAAVAELRERREIMGSALLAYLPIGVAFSATIFLLSFWIDGWFNVDASHAMRVAAPFVIGAPFAFVLQQLAQGLDRLHVSAVATVLAQLFLVALFALAVGVGPSFSPALALALRGAAFTAAGVTCALWLRPTFRRVRHWSREFVQQAREWGFQLYIGRVLSIGTYNMDVLMLGIWTSSRSVGFYVLAGSLATVSGLPVSGAAAALFGRMARRDSLRRQWLVLAVGVGMASALSAWLVAKPFITLFFGSSYAGAATLVLPLVLAQFVRGVTTMFNTFLSAHGRGTDLRNAGLVLAMSNVAFNFALIPRFGAQGAAWASLLALGANFLAHLHFYRRSYAL